MSAPIKAGLTALFTLAIVACGNGKPAGPAGPLPPLTVADFPMEVGCHWVYHVVDTLSGDEDTVDVEIRSGQLDSSGTRVTIWHYSSRHDVFQRESVFVSILGDSVWFSGGLGWTPTRTLVFPLTTGKVWWHRSWCGGDSSIVSREELIRTPFSVCRTYRVETVTVPFAMDNICRSRLWLAARVGLVRVILTTGFRRDENVIVWNLLEYNPPGGD